jgi:hypothetical protein
VGEPGLTATVEPLRASFAWWTVADPEWITMLVAENPTKATPKSRANWFIFFLSEE